MLSKVVSSSIFKVFGMTRPGIEPRSPGPLANTLTAGPMLLVLCLYTSSKQLAYKIGIWLWNLYSVFFHQTSKFPYLPTKSKRSNPIGVIARSTKNVMFHFRSCQCPISFLHTNICTSLYLEATRLNFPLKKKTKKKKKKKTTTKKHPP